MKYSCLTYLSHKAILLRFEKNLFEPIFKTADELDAAVFQQQLKTGSYYGRFPVNEMQLEIMKRRGEKGIKMPYYFTDGGGMLGYEIIFNSSGIVLQTKHVISEEPFRIIIQNDSIKELKQKWYKFGQRPELDDNYYEFSINDEGLKKLNGWEHWQPDDAFSDRYEYFFLRTSLGQIIKVTNQNNRAQIDISNYDDW